MILLVFLASGFANSEGFVPQAPSVRALPIFFAPGSNSHLAHRVSTSHQKVGSGQIAPPASVQRTESVTMLKLSEGSGADVEVIVPKNMSSLDFQFFITYSDLRDLQRDVQAIDRERSKLRGKNQNLMVQRERDFLLAEIDRLWEEKCQLQDKEKQLREKELKLLDIKMRRGIPANWLAYLLGTLFLIALCTD